MSGQGDIERVGLCGAPLQGRRLIYSNSRVHGNRTLGVVSRSLTTITGYLIKHATITVLNAPKSLSGWESRKDLKVLCCYMLLLHDY